MLKRKGFATLSGILLAISIIAPFSFAKVNAANTGNPVLRVLYSFESSSGETYVHCDFIYTNTNASSYGSFIFSYIREGVVPSIGMTDGTGVTSIEYENYTDGSYNYRRYEVEYHNTGFFIVRITFKGASTYWTQAALHNPTSKLGLSFNNYTVGYLEQMGDNQTLYLWQISNYLRNGLSINTSNIEDLLEDIITNQQTIIANQQGNQSSSDVVDDNDDLIDQGTDVISDYDDLVSTFDSDFGDQQEEMTDILQNTSLTAFSDAAIWFTQQLASLYSSMGDMQILVTMPLLLGIALFFVGRGALVFRSPESTVDSVNTVQVWDDDGHLRDSYFVHNLVETTRKKGIYRPWLRRRK